MTHLPFYCIFRPVVQLINATLSLNGGHCYETKENIYYAPEQKALFRTDINAKVILYMDRQNV